MTPDTKFCEGPCQRTLPVERFSLNRCGQPGEMGRARMCKDCTSAYMKRRYWENDGALRKQEYRHRKRDLERHRISALSRLFY